MVPPQKSLVLSGAQCARGELLCGIKDEALLGIATPCYSTIMSVLNKKLIYTKILRQWTWMKPVLSVQICSLRWAV